MGEKNRNKLFLVENAPETTKIANDVRAKLYREVQEINDIAGDGRGSNLLMDAAMVLISIAGDAVARSNE